MREKDDEQNQQQHKFTHEDGRECRWPRYPQAISLPIFQVGNVVKADRRCQREHYGWQGESDVTEADGGIVEKEDKADAFTKHDLGLSEFDPSDPEDHGDTLAELIWSVSRRDESTISATGANIIAAAIRSKFNVSPRLAPLGRESDSEFGYPSLGNISRYLGAEGVQNIAAVYGGRIVIGGPLVTGVTAQGNLSRPERVGNVFDEAQALYRRKAAGYADTADTLGAKGQFADMNRKFGKLKAMLWDESIPAFPDAGVGEDILEILQDMMGHCALTIDFVRQQQAENNKEEGSK